MSYLHLPSLNMVDIKKGTISLWFRFSQDSVDKAALYKSPKSHPEAPDIFDSTIPLVTFGRKVTAKVYDSIGKTWTGPVLPDSTAPPPTVSAPQVDEVEGEFHCAPSHIGIICGETPTLVMKFQTGTRAKVQGLHGQITDVTWIPVYDVYEPHETIEDVSYIEVGEPESFLIVPTFTVDVDQWHHLLVSFDFSTDVDVVAFEGEAATEDELREKTIKSFCKVWFAFDDENKKGKDNIGNNRDASFRSISGWTPADKNGVIPMNAEAAIFTYVKPPVKDPLDHVAESPEYHWVASPLPINGGPVGLPASADYVETIYHCEMAEFQFFGNLVLDTANMNNRRMFVDGDGKPVPPDETHELLNRRPDILLHGSGNWQTGHNTGSSGVEIDSDGTMTDLPAGQFKRIAGINKYKPEPALETGTA